MEDSSRHQVIFLGDSAVGKTSIISQYIYNTSNSDHKPTIGVDFFSKNVEIQDSDPPKTVRMQIWDTAGQERFHAVIPSYIRNSTVAVLVFDITSIASFENLTKWFKNVTDISHHDVSFVIVGNKVDLEDNRTVQTEKAKSFASSIKAKYIETSARTPININKLFLEIAKCPIVKDTLKEPKIADQKETQNIESKPEIKLGADENKNTNANGGFCGC